MQIDTDGPIVTAKLVEKLSSKKEAERLEAERVLQALGPQAIDALLPILGQEAATRKKRNQILVTFICVLAGLILVSTLFSSMMKHHVDWTNISTCFTSFSSLAGVAYAATTVQKNGTRLLAQYEDLRSVGAFAEALEYGDKEIRQIAEAKLIVLLPRLQASNEELLNPLQRGCLNRALSSKNVPLVLAILKAYEQIGDESALSSVEKLATSKSKEQIVVQAAKECLPYLQLRIVKSKEKLSLLRASSAETTSPDMLLRAASGSPATAPDQLLRACNTAQTAEQGTTTERVDTAAYATSTSQPTEQTVQH